MSRLCDWFIFFGISPGLNQPTAFISRLLTEAVPTASARNIISTWRPPTVRTRNNSAPVISIPVSSRNSRRTAATGCSPWARKPPGAPQLEAVRKTWSSSKTSPLSLTIIAATETVNVGCVTRTIIRLNDGGRFLQIV